MNKLYTLRKLFSLRLTLILCSLSAMLSAMAAPVYPHYLRIVSYNICHGEGLDGRLDFLRLCNVLEQQSPDVVALQEVDSCTARCQGRYGLGEMANRMGYFASFGPAIDYDGGKYGVGLLSRQRPLSVRQIPLPVVWSFLGRVRRAIGLAGILKTIILICFPLKQRRFGLVDGIVWESLQPVPIIPPLLPQ